MDIRTVISPATAFNPPNLNRLPPLVEAPGLVRLVKDCLRVGTWITGRRIDGTPKLWPVTDDTLKQIEAAYAEQLAVGLVPPLCFKHSTSDPADPDEQNSVASIAHLWHEGGTLYFAVYVTPEVAADLQKMHRQVSIKCLFDFEHTSKLWPVFVQHVAIVQHARVHDQMPFVQMGTGGESEPPSPEPEKEAPKMDFAAVVALFNRLLEANKPGTSLTTEGDGAVTEENFIEIATAVVNSILPAEGEQETKSGDVPPVMNDVEMSALFTQKFDAFHSLVKSHLDGDKNASFKAKVAEHLKRGVPAGICQAAEEMGVQFGNHGKVLSMLDAVPALALGGQAAATLATNAAPPMSLPVKEMSDAEVTAEIARLSVM